MCKLLFVEFHFLKFRIQTFKVTMNCRRQIIYDFNKLIVKPKKKENLL